jgi:hypothetical protein
LLDDFSIWVQSDEIIGIADHGRRGEPLAPWTALDNGSLEPV